MDGGRVTRRSLIAGLAAVATLRSAPATGGSGSGLLSRPAEVAGLARTRRVDPPERDGPAWTIGEIGRSLEGRPIERFDSRPEQSRRHVVVVCGVHGDERAAAELADAFVRIQRPDDLHLTIIPQLNPDGWARGTRLNARPVDLNRNFPWSWPAQAFSGSGPASEPETRAAMEFLGSSRPDLVIWVHQPLSYVSAIPGCPEWYADIWSEYAGVRVRRPLLQVGGGESWASQGIGLASMLVEVGGTRRVGIGVGAHAKALEALLFAVQPA